VPDWQSRGREFHGKPDFRRLDPFLFTMPANGHWRMGEQVGKAWGEEEGERVNAPSWQFDESDHSGKDFADPEVVDAYDARHRTFRDIDGENVMIMAGLGIRSQHAVADFGCGTGDFAICAARQCATVYAIDISAAMLRAVAWKAARFSLTNIVTRLGGFLTYEHRGDPLDAITSSFALHHLPDFWKAMALKRLNTILRDDGRLHLMDVAFAEDRCATNIDAWIAKMEQQVGPNLAQDLSHHVSKEHSTFTWILEGLLERAGFRIDRRDYTDGVLASFFCTKVSPAEP
jgi:putative AdoMet-dependent methyltransferase